MSGPAAMEPGEQALAGLLERCRVAPGRPFDLEAYDPHPHLPPGLDKEVGAAMLKARVRALSDAQDLLYAHGTWAVLVVIQAQDAAGKDGTIKHVLSGINPAGVGVTSFKAPGPEDLAHDFLWRVSRVAPARGTIGVFNRSHYEEVLVPRVRPEVLARQRLPAALTEAPGFWDGRLEDIAAFERHLAREGTRIVKLFLNVSRAEQKERLLARLDEPDKLWKFDPADLDERARWDAYRAAYAAAITATAIPEAPWFVIPADRKWLMRLLVAEAMLQALRGLDLGPVTVPRERAAMLRAARERLAAGP